MRHISYLFKRIPFNKELLQIFSISLFVILVVFGIAWATNSGIFETDDLETARTNFSVLGNISEINSKSISLIDANGSDDTATSSVYQLNIKHLEKVESPTYEALAFSALEVGDKIIAQGKTNGSEYFILRIISFAEVVEIEVEETTTATTTEDVATSTEDTATTTEEVATTTEEIIEDTATTTEATTTEEVIVEEETATTTEEVIEETATTTEEVIEDTATTTDETATSTESG
jgi:hypothetical protein